MRKKREGNCRQGKVVSTLLFFRRRDRIDPVRGKIREEKGEEDSQREKGKIIVFSAPLDVSELSVPALAEQKWSLKQQQKKGPSGDGGESRGGGRARTKSEGEKQKNFDEEG